MKSLAGRLRCAFAGAAAAVGKPLLASRDIGFAPITAVPTQRDQALELVGVPPAEIQHDTSPAAAPLKVAANADFTRTFVRYRTRAEGKALSAAAGVDPGRSFRGDRKT